MVTQFGYGVTILRYIIVRSHWFYVKPKSHCCEVWTSNLISYLPTYIEDKIIPKIFFSVNPILSLKGDTIW